MNARTGKQERAGWTADRRREYRTEKRQTQKPRSYVLGGPKPTQFQQYQQKLFALTNNDRIKKVLNTSNRHKISADVEAMCISRYVKRKYQADTFTENKVGADGKPLADIPPDKVEEIKRQYFSDVLAEYRNKTGKEIDSTIFDAVRQVPAIADAVADDLLSKNEGLKKDGGRIEPYQFDDDLVT